MQAQAQAHNVYVLFRKILGKNFSEKYQGTLSCSLNKSTILLIFTFYA
jgi:hypothetical protein